MSSSAQPITQPAEIAAVARDIAAAGSFALDLEFASAGRYQPELALVQVAWGQVGEPPDDGPYVAAIDPLAADPLPIVALVASPEIVTLIHAAQGDLALLSALFGTRARRVVDTQIAAAFLGLGDQVGYAALVERLLGTPLDKAMQFTDWLARPLSPEQIRYALDDVRYLPRVWRELGERLAGRGRVAWVEAESDRLAESATRRLAPEDSYLRLGAWQTMLPRPLAALQALADWRERQAIEDNRPPSWIVKDRALIELARRLPASPGELAAIEGLGPTWIDRHGRHALAAIRRSKGRRVEPPRPGRASVAQRKRASKLWSRLEELARQAEVAPRFVATRAEVDALLAWWTSGDRDREPDLALLGGWRRELAGQPALDWLARSGPPLSAEQDGGL